MFVWVPLFSRMETLLDIVIAKRVALQSHAKYVAFHSQDKGYNILKYIVG